MSVESINIGKMSRRRAVSNGTIKATACVWESRRCLINLFFVSIVNKLFTRSHLLLYPSIPPCMSHSSLSDEICRRLIEHVTYRPHFSGIFLLLSQNKFISFDSSFFSCLKVHFFFGNLPMIVKVPLTLVVDE